MLLPQKLVLGACRSLVAPVLSVLVFMIGNPSEAWSCRLALVFAIDVSRSVDSAEYALQFQGLADALRDEEVQKVILDRGDPVALAAFEWGGVSHQNLVADWSLLVNIHHVGIFATRLERQPRTVLGQKTATGMALSFAWDLLAKSPPCAHRIVDLSSDGYSNQGPTPQEVYRSQDFADIAVNALVISGLKRPALQHYFETDVLRGPGAFALPTKGFEDYAEAIRRKLLRELRGGEDLAGAWPKEKVKGN